MPSFRRAGMIQSLHGVGGLGRSEVSVWAIASGCLDAFSKSLDDTMKGVGLVADLPRTLDVLVVLEMFHVSGLLGWSPDWVG